jgi:predicted NAD/FAD-binding protein
MKIGIVGTGISGLVTAYYLSRDHDVRLFEAGNYVGGHTNTHDVHWAGQDYAIDTGFIVFNDRTYPGFIRIMNELGVAWQPAPMTFSVRNDQTGLEYRGADFQGLFAQRRNWIRPRHWLLLAEMLRFNRRAEGLLAGEPDALTVAEFFAKHRFSSDFRRDFFYPMASAIWSCPASLIDQFPIRFIVEFYRHHGLLSINDRPQWRVIVGGSKQYIPKLTQRFADRIRLQCPIVGFQRNDQYASLQTQDGNWHEFDQVVFACHADQSLRILGSAATAVEREILSAFPYERNIAWLHTDTSVLPKQQRAWAAWNYHLAAGDSDKATVTYNMNILQGIRSPHTFCVSLNSQQLIDRSKLIREIEYHHPVFTPHRRAFQQRHAELVAHGRASYVGAYWGNGFHEDGVQSALFVVERLAGKACSVVSTKAGSVTVG